MVGEGRQRETSDCGEKAGRFLKTLCQYPVSIHGSFVSFDKMSVTRSVLPTRQYSNLLDRPNMFSPYHAEIYTESQEFLMYGSFMYSDCDFYY